MKREAYSDILDIVWQPINERQYNQLKMMDIMLMRQRIKHLFVGCVSYPAWYGAAVDIDEDKYYIIHYVDKKRGVEINGAEIPTLESRNVTEKKRSYLRQVRSASNQASGTGEGGTK